MRLLDAKGMLTVEGRGARIAALGHAPAAFASPLPYDAWLAREYGGPVQLSDLTHFPDAHSRAIARGAYKR